MTSLMIEMLMVWRRPKIDGQMCFWRDETCAKPRRHHQHLFFALEASTPFQWCLPKTSQACLVKSTNSDPLATVQVWKETDSEMAAILLFLCQLFFWLVNSLNTRFKKKLVWYNFEAWALASFWKKLEKLGVIKQRICKVKKATQCPMPHALHVTAFCQQDLKDYCRQAGDVTYGDAHKQKQGEGWVRLDL